MSGGESDQTMISGAGASSTASLRVFETFDSLQGEGYWTGVPMTFVRLAGCNAPDLALDCVHWCDTRSSWPRSAGEQVAIADIVERARYPRMCLTGGEPLLQREGVAALLAAAHAADLRVHVETNGTIGPELPPAVDAPRVGGPGQGRLDFDWVVVSPKPPDFIVAAGWVDLVDELKLVADERLDEPAAEALAAAHPGAFVCIQPLAALGGADAANAGASSLAERVSIERASIDRAVTLVMRHPDWRLSLQTHKLLGLR